MDSVVDLKTLKEFIDSDENNKNFKLKGIYLIERLIYLQDKDAIEFLLNSNANIIIPKLMEQPIKFNNKEIIDLLFSYSSQSYEIVDSKKHNAFHYAIKYFNNYVIDELIDKINLFEVDNKKYSYLHYAIKKKNDYVIKKIIDKIFKERNVDEMNLSLINIFNMTNDNNETPLLLMVKNGVNYRIDEIIDDLYVNLNIQDKNFESVLSFSLINFNKTIFEILINSINYVNWNLQDKNGNTLLHLLVNYEKIQLIKFLFYKQLNINTNIYNIDYEIPLLILLKKYKKNKQMIMDNINVVKDLIKYSNLFLQDKKGNCCMYYIIKHHSYLKELFKELTIPNIINSKGVGLKDVDKDGMFKYEEKKKEKKLLKINYSSMPFDIVCFMMNLKANNIFINFDLDKLEINDTINISILDLFLLWDGELHNKDILKSLKDFEKNDKNLMVMFLMIEYEGINHANVLIVNKKENLVYRFDPYGYYYSDSYGLNELDEILEKEVKEYGFNYSFFNKQIGIQQIENNMKRDINDLNGYCVSWCMMIVNDINLNYNKSISDTIETLVMLYNDKMYYEYSLKKTQETANKLRDMVLLNCEINFSDYINNDINVKDSKKMIESLKKIIKMFK